MSVPFFHFLFSLDDCLRFSKSSSSCLVLSSRYPRWFSISWLCSLNWQVVMTPCHWHVTQLPLYAQVDTSHLQTGDSNSFFREIELDRSANHRSVRFDGVAILKTRSHKKTVTTTASSANYLPLRTHLDSFFGQITASVNCSSVSSSSPSLFKSWFPCQCVRIHLLCHIRGYILQGVDIERLFQNILSLSSFCRCFSGTATRISFVVKLIDRTYERIVSWLCYCRFLFDQFSVLKRMSCGVCVIGQFVVIWFSFSID